MLEWFGIPSDTLDQKITEALMALFTKDGTDIHVDNFNDHPMKMLVPTKLPMTGQMVVIPQGCLVWWIDVGISLTPTNVS